MSEDPSAWIRTHKPFSGPLQRIINENNVQRVKSPGKLSPSSPLQSIMDQENVQILTKISDKRMVSLSSQSLSRDLGESIDFFSQEAMSSTLAMQQSCLSTPERLKSSLFSASNLSSISSVVNASQSTSTSPQPGRFKTPKRTGDLVSNTAVFSTPSSGSCGTRSLRGTSSPSTNSSPWSSGSGIRYNPFDSQLTSEQLHLPTLSPSVFATVTSPSDESSVNGHFWNIEQQAELYPTTISDDSPLKQSILHKHHRHESEAKTQEQIELYFKTYHDVTSPPDLAPTGPLLVDSPNSSYVQPETGKSSKWTQTCMTLPPILPPQVENILRQYNFLTDVTEEPNNLSNSTLRRKLFNVDMFSDADDSQRQSSSESEDDTSPCKMTPGKIIHTPVTNRAGTSAQWSSSPVRPPRHRASLSPPDLHSPMFSPIAKSRGSAKTPSSMLLQQVSSIIEEEFEQEEEEVENDISDPERETSELYKTAEIPDMTSTSCCNMTCNMASTSCIMDTDSNSGAAWGLTLPTQDEEDSNMNTESRIDTGYTTNTVSSIHPSAFQDSVQPSNLEMDSGVSTSQQPDLTVSLILPPQIPQHNQVQQPPVVLMSYAAENTNDISVGFPLGSSTPTKR